MNFLNKNSVLFIISSNDYMQVIEMFENKSYSASKLFITRFLITFHINENFTTLLPILQFNSIQYVHKKIEKFKRGKLAQMYIHITYIKYLHIYNICDKYYNICIFIIFVTPLVGNLLYMECVNIPSKNFIHKYGC